MINLGQVKNELKMYLEIVDVAVDLEIDRRDALDELYNNVKKLVSILEEHLEDK